MTNPFRLRTLLRTAALLCAGLLACPFAACAAGTGTGDAPAAPASGTAAPGCPDETPAAETADTTPAPVGDEAVDTTPETTPDTAADTAEDTTSEAAPAKPGLIGQDEIDRAAAECGIGRDSDAYRALCDVNDVYYPLLNARMKRETLIFFFEGVGDNCKRRFSAMCVVVKDGKIAFCDTRSSTAPDYPFDPSRNNGKDMGIVVDGIYKYTTVDHNGQYASLNINTPHLVRFHDPETFYTNDNGYGFDIHRRYSNGPAPRDADWVNSAGCFLVGMAGSEPYTPFVRAVGMIPEDSELTVAQKQVTGHVIVDRYYACDFLSSLGYPDEAIALIREASVGAREGK